jgi:hypothetical protein
MMTAILEERVRVTKRAGLLLIVLGESEIFGAKDSRNGRKGREGKGSS